MKQDDILWAVGRTENVLTWLGKSAGWEKW